MTDVKFNVYQKIQKIRVELQRSKIKKSGKNAFAGFTYFNLSDFLPTLNDLMDKYGLSSNFSIQEDKAILHIINSDKIEEFALFLSPIADAPVKGCTPVQALGAVHTYMKRYLYLNAFEIVEDDMLDAQAGNIKTNYDEKIINGLNAISTIADLNKYYEQNKKDVDDLKKFQKAYSEKAKELTKAVQNDE